MGALPIIFWLAVASGAGRIDFARQVLPVLQRACVNCHGEAKREAGLRLDSGEALRKGGVSGEALVPGHSDKSYLVQRLLGQGGEDRMPVEGDPLPPADIELVRRWIDQGAQVPVEIPPAFRPAPAGLRRLTVPQYENAVRDLLDEAVPTKIEADDLSSSGFTSVASYKAITSERGVEQYREAAIRLARQVFHAGGKREEIVGCRPRSAADPCVRGFLARFGRRAFRRPLASAELDAYRRLVAHGAAVRKDVWRGLEVALAALLQSPAFLYVAERGEPDPAEPGRLRYSSWEMASRLSFFLWSSIPDVELLDAAEAGRLATAEGVRAEVKRMMASPRAQAGVRQFFGEYLALDELRGLSKDEKIYPLFSGSVGAAFRQEAERTALHLVFDRNGSILDLFDTRETFVNGELARIYGFAEEPLAPEIGATEEFRKVRHPEEGPRAGLFGMGAFLAAHASATRSSPTLRGVFVRERLLCQEVPPPPPGTSTELKPAKKGAPPKTMREMVKEHATNPTCANCHAFFDPLGLALEQFDGLGGFRETDQGEPLDLSAKVDGKKVVGARELGALLKRDPRTAACMARQLYEFAVGHSLTPGERPALSGIEAAFARSGHNFRDLVVAVATSDGFRYAGGNR